MASICFSSPDSGFSLLEVLVALVILTLTVLTVAHLTIQSTALAERTRRDSLAVALAAERLEQLRGLGWGFGDGEQPAVADVGSDLGGAMPASGGRGLLQSPPGTLAANTPGYVDFLDSGGGWVGRDRPPRDTFFVRRWSVDDGPFASGTLVLQVVVGLVGPGAGMLTEPAPVTLATLKARKAG